MSTLNVTLPEALRQFVEEQVVRGGYASADEYINALVREARTRAEPVPTDLPSVLPNGTHDEDDAATVFDLLNRAGLIGAIHAGDESPNDLSTNPKHMEGFGGE